MPARPKRQPGRRPTLGAAFGQVLRDLREARGISQERLGLQSGIHRTTFSLMERGLMSPSMATVFRLAESFQITPSELVRRVESLRPLVPPVKPGHGLKR